MPRGQELHHFRRRCGSGCARPTGPEVRYRRLDDSCAACHGPVRLYELRRAYEARLQALTEQLRAA